MGKGDLYLDTERMLETEHTGRRRNSVPLWLKMKIFASLCCCTICGIASLAYTVTSQRSLAQGDDYGSQRKHRRARCCLLSSIILGLLFMAGLAVLDYYYTQWLIGFVGKFCSKQDVCLTADGIPTTAADPMGTCSPFMTCVFPIPSYMQVN